jgi:hypothetical protein
VSAIEAIAAEDGLAPREPVLPTLPKAEGQAV